MKIQRSGQEKERGLFRRIDWLLLLLVTLCAGTSVLMLHVMYVQSITDEVDSNDGLVQLIAMGIWLRGWLGIAAIYYHKLACLWLLY